MSDRNKPYDYDSRNKRFEKHKDLEAFLDSCINNMLVKPIVNINADIEGLEASMFTTDMNEEGTVNYIIIKPIVNIDIEITGLNTAKDL